MTPHPPAAGRAHRSAERGTRGAFVATSVAWTAFVGLYLATSAGAPLARATWACALAASFGASWLWTRWGALDARAQALGIAAGVAAGLAFAWQPPVFSDDLWRYLVDGTAGAAGVSPFAYPPASPKVADWVAEVGGSVNHPELPTIYPPLAQLLFASTVALEGGARAWRLLCFGAALAAARWVDRGSAAAGDDAQRRARPLLPLVALHPLCLVAIAGSGHVDTFGLVAGCVLVAGWRSRNRLVRLAGWTLAGGIKIVPALFAVSEAGVQAGDASAPRGRRFARGALTAAAALGALVAGYLVLDRDPSGWTGSGPTYATRWANGAGLARWVHDAVVALAPDTTFALDAGTRVNAWLGRGRTTPAGLDPTSWWSPGEVANALVRVLAAVALSATAVRSWLGRATPEGFARSLWMVLLLFSPVFHPWYALWLVPLAAAAPAKAARWLVAAAPLAWWGAAHQWDTGAWTDPVATGLVLWLPAWWWSLRAPRRADAPKERAF